ncbi:MAG: outer rane lipoproteinsorting protein [Bacteroidota bacterium]|nr:outer rane lipoproteinsorting protein [Bacteroidota bacterium]
MRNRFILLFLFLSGSLFAQTADDIINKHFEATGGKDKWARVVAIHYNGNYVLGPGMLAPVVQLEVAKPFKGTYSEFSWQGMTNKRAMRADSGWRYNPFSGKRETDPLSPNDIRSEKLDADPQGLLFNYKEKGYTVEYLGTDDMDGTDVFKLRLTTKEGDMVYYYIDAETYYILKEVKRVKLKDKEEKQYATFSDFRKTDFGVVIPFSYQQVDENGNEQGGPVIFTKVEVNGVVDATLFDKPKAK